MGEHSKELERHKKRLDKLWGDTHKIKREFDSARPVVERYVEVFNRHSRSKINLEKFKVPSEEVVFRVMDKIERENPDFDKIEFLEAFRKVRKYFKYLEKIDKATRKIVRLENEVQA